MVSPATNLSGKVKPTNEKATGRSWWPFALAVLTQVGQRCTGSVAENCPAKCKRGARDGAPRYLDDKYRHLQISRRATPNAGGSIKRLRKGEGARPPLEDDRERWNGL